MKTLIFILLGFVWVASACTSRADNPGEFTLQSAVDDSTFELSKQKGKIVVLHFLLKTECPVCLRYTHDYAAMAEKDQDIVHVFIKPDTNAEIKTWAEQLSKDDLMDLPKIYRDPDAKLADRFGVPNGYKFHGQNVHFPALIVLDQEAKELFRYVGKSNSDRMKPRDFIRTLAEKRGVASKKGVRGEERLHDTADR